MGILYGILGLAAVIGIWGVLLYNRFITLGKMREEGWSGVLVQLKRRHDLVPNLVNAVKGYMTHEKSVLEDLTKTRATQGTAAQVAASENQFTQTLSRLFALAENYPDLKASTNFLSLQESLQDIEDEVQLARRYYNGTVRDYNILVESFPSLIVARMFGFRQADFFELEDAKEAAVPQVSF